MHEHSATWKMAVSATLHCLLGCSIGEIVGLLLGTWFGWHNALTVTVSILLAFVTGYILSTLPLIKSGLAIKTALVTVLAADTLLILAMELADNGIMLAIPGAMNAGLGSPLFWLTMPIALAVGFAVATPVNYILLKYGKGHALTHHYHHGHNQEEEHHHEHDAGLRHH